LALCALHALVGIVNLLPIEPFDGAVIWHRRSDTPAKPEVESRAEPTSVEEFLAEVSEPEPEFIPLDDDPPLDVDQILEKILATGMESLTDNERLILQEASRHLRR
jgi:uncharacterized protein DUF6576